MKSNNQSIYLINISIHVIENICIFLLFRIFYLLLLNFVVFRFSMILYRGDERDGILRCWEVLIVKSMLCVTIFFSGF